MVHIEKNQDSASFQGVSWNVSDFLQSLHSQEFSCPVTKAACDCTLHCQWFFKMVLRTKLCMLCASIFHLKGIGGDETEEKILSTFCKQSQLKLSSDAEIVDSWNRMAERFNVLSQVEFNEWQQATGISFSPHDLSSSTLQSDGLLLPASRYCHDYMHTMCSNGIMVDAVYLVLEALFSAGYNAWGLLGQWLSLWVLPN